MGYNIEPLEKQKKAFDNIVENQGNVYKAMIDAGYTKVTAKNSKQNLTSTKGFKLLKQDYLKKLSLERSRILDELSSRNLSTVDYRALTDSLDKIARQFNTLTGEGEQTGSITIQWKN